MFKKTETESPKKNNRKSRQKKKRTKNCVPLFVFSILISVLFFVILAVCVFHVFLFWFVASVSVLCFCFYDIDSHHLLLK